MACKLLLNETDTKVRCGVADGELTEFEAIEDLELYRDRVVLACNRAIAELRAYLEDLDEKRDAA